MFRVPTKLQENMFITITIDNLTCPISSGYSQMNSRIQLGPLHIEQVFTEVIDWWLARKLNGKKYTYDYANINLNGRADGFLTRTGDFGIKRSRYAHQLTLASLVTLASYAFNAQTFYSDSKAWKADLASLLPQQSISLRWQSFKSCFSDVLRWHESFTRVIRGTIQTAG